MAAPLGHADVPQLIIVAEAVAEEIKQTFGALAPAQLNWKANAAGWSIGQCFDHIITSPAARGVTYSLLDAYRIILVHEQLHLAQAGRVLNSMTQAVSAQ